jgi:glycosyltransferase involved in cell wall biosynthesis
MKILHLSADYPDALQLAKTHAVLELVEGMRQHDHFVYSLNRVTAFSGISALPFGEQRMALAYGGLPRGFFMKNRIQAVAEWILTDLRRTGFKPDLIHAHKLTIEGIAGLKIAQKLGYPLICSIQGDTDTRILRMRPDLRRLYQEIVDYSHFLLHFGAWSLPVLKKFLYINDKKQIFLPVISQIEHFKTEKPKKNDQIITIFNLDSWRRKNLLAMAEAVSALRKEFPALHLDIYGRGSSQALLEVQKALHKHGFSDCITLKGAVAPHNLPHVLQEYTAFVMPSLRETYGLVYVESLFSGVPILFSLGQGIDGIFSAEQIGYACDPMNLESITQGIRTLILQEESLKKNLAYLQKTGAFEPLRREAILQKYDAVLRLCLKIS